MKSRHKIHDKRKKIIRKRMTKRMQKLRQMMIRKTCGRPPQQQQQPDPALEKRIFYGFKIKRKLLKHEPLVRQNERRN